MWPRLYSQQDPNPGIATADERVWMLTPTRTEYIYCTQRRKEHFKKHIGVMSEGTHGCRNSTLLVTHIPRTRQLEDLSPIIVRAGIKQHREPPSVIQVLKQPHRELTRIGDRSNRNIPPKRPVFDNRGEFIQRRAWFPTAEAAVRYFIILIEWARSRHIHQVHATLMCLSRSCMYGLHAYTEPGYEETEDTPRTGDELDNWAL